MSLMLVEDSEEDKPLVSLAWQNIQVTATVLGLGMNQTVAALVYPRYDDKLPYRRGIKLPLANMAKKLQQQSVLMQQKQQQQQRPVMKVPSNANQQQRQQQQAGGAAGKAIKKCHICGRGFNKATYLKRHILSHSSVKPFKCNICGWGFFQYCNLKRHMTSHTISGEGYKCCHCRASFSTKSVLSVHMRDAHGDKLASSKKSKTNNTTTGSMSLLKVPKTIEKNQAVISGNSPKAEAIVGEESAGPNSGAELPRGFSCTLCQASFDKVSLLNKHFRTHSNANGGVPEAR